MGMQEVRIHEDEGKPDSFAKLTFDQSLVNVFDEASEPLKAFCALMEDIGSQVFEAPDPGYGPLCAKVLVALLDQQRRVMAQAVECVDGQVGMIVLNAHNYSFENREERIAGQYCRARIAKREVHHG
jgi:hypothetical protein